MLYSIYKQYIPAKIQVSIVIIVNDYVRLILVSDSAYNLYIKLWVTLVRRCVYWQSSWFNYYAGKCFWPQGYVTFFFQFFVLMVFCICLMTLLCCAFLHFVLLTKSMKPSFPKRYCSSYVAYDLNSGVRNTLSERAYGIFSDTVNFYVLYRIWNS